MCLITQQQEPIVLQEDLIVYKMFYQIDPDNTATAPFRNFNYEINKLYKTPIKVATLFGYFDSEVDYCYGKKGISFWRCSGWDFVENLKEKGCNIFGEGFHFITSIDRAIKANYRNNIILECIIPKGSEVYFDETNLGITNQIIVTNKIINTNYDKYNDNNKLKLYI